MDSMSLSDVWIKLVEQSNLTDQQMFVIGTCACNIIAFWGYNAILGVMYYFDMFPQFKIQGDLKTNHELIWINIRDYLIAQFVTIPIISYFLYYVFVHQGMTIRSPIPSPTIFARDFLISLLLTDFFGYFWHRAMHHKSIYKYVHKHHHQYKVNIGIAAIFAHPVEDFGNTLTVISGSLFTGCHVLVFWTWITVRLLEAINAHSGYHFLPLELTGFLSGGEFHEFHHSHNVGNYGAFFTFWDTLFGTDVAYNEYQQNKKLLKKGSAQVKKD